MPEGDNYVYPKDSDGKRWERIKQSILVCFGYGDRHLLKVSKKTDMPGARLTDPTHALEHINMPEGDMPGARLAVPTHALEHINMPVGANYVNLSPTDSDGKEWSFRCYTRPDGHPKPALTTGWLKFVRAKGLQIDDEVTFSKLEDEAGGAPQGEQNMVDLPQQIVG